MDLIKTLEALPGNFRSSTLHPTLYGWAVLDSHAAVTDETADPRTAYNGDVAPESADHHPSRHAGAAARDADEARDAVAGFTYPARESSEAGCPQDDHRSATAQAATCDGQAARAVAVADPSHETDATRPCAHR